MKKSPVHECETEGWIPSRYALQDDFNDSVSEKRSVSIERVRERNGSRVRTDLFLAVPVSREQQTPGINQAWL